MRSLTAQSVLESLSYTHIEQLIALDSSEKIDFYCFHCIEGCWSVRELKRQIASLLYERSQLSIDKQRLTEVTQAKSEKQQPMLAIRDPCVFEFLGLKPAEVNYSRRNLTWHKTTHYESQDDSNWKNQ